jgi:hypothetical protein
VAFPCTPKCSFETALALFVRRGLLSKVQAIPGRLVSRGLVIKTVYVWILTLAGRGVATHDVSVETATLIGSAEVVTCAIS